MTSTIDPARIERNWQAIAFELDAPRPSPIERLLRLAGLPSTITRLVVATPALRRAWFVALGLAMIVGVASADAARPRDDLFVLLLIAPLVPTLGVTLAYGPHADPSHEVTLATPMSGLRLVLLRTAAVVGCSTLFLGFAALLTPSTPPMAFAWMLPSLGLSGATLGTMTYLAPRRAGLIVAVAWIAFVILARWAGSDPLAAFTLLGQCLMVVLTVAGLAVAVARRDRFDLLVAA